MVGNFVGNTCKVVESSRRIILDKNISNSLLKLSHLQGKGGAYSGLSRYIIDSFETTDEVESYLIDNIKTNVDEPYMNIIKEIQDELKINDKFFIYSLEENVINIFDISYREVLDSKYKISDDFKKVALIEKE